MSAHAAQVNLLGQAIRARRLERFLTQQDLADALTAASGGDVILDRSAISRWESGDNAPSLRHKALLVEVLELPTSFINGAAA